MDILKKIEKEGRKTFNSWIIHETREAQKKYGFDMTKHEYSYSDTHNNEADAFKHAYMSWFLSYWGNDIKSKELGDMHEDETPNAPAYERNMDLWNNAIGREIAYDMKWQLGDDYDLLGEEWAIQTAKRKIWEKMQQGELITNPITDKRKYENMELERFTENDRVYSNDEFRNFNEKMREVYSGKYMDYIIDNDWEVPSVKNLDKKVQSRELIYVNNYITSDGRKLNGYYKRRPYYSWLENKQKEEKVIKGRISNKTYIWRAEPNACGVCAELDGTEYDNEWEIPQKPHPNCRCTIEEVYDR